MLRVGINTNVKLSSASINEKGSLVLGFTDSPVAQKNADDALLDGLADRKDSSESTIMLFPFKAEEQDGSKREVKRIAQDVAALRDQLQHILQGFVVAEESKLNTFDGIDTSDPAFLSKQSVLDRIYKNLTSQFIAKVNTLGDKLKQEFRLLLIRRSASSHYGTLRKNFINDNPFFESMSVPADASKLKFTKYEKDKGLDKGEPVSQAAADAQPQEETSTASGILGSR